MYPEHFLKVGRLHAVLFFFLAADVYTDVAPVVARSIGTVGSDI